MSILGGKTKADEQRMAAVLTYLEYSLGGAYAPLEGLDLRNYPQYKLAAKGYIEENPNAYFLKTYRITWEGRVALGEYRIAREKERTR